MPLRMCCVCRTQREKAEMIRVACPKGAMPQLDPSCRSMGRGAYFCSIACLQQAQKRHALERAFGKRISPEVYDRILAGVTHE